MLASGRLDRRVRLERYSETVDDYGEPVKTWAELATVAASFEPLTDGERVRSQQVGGSASARFQIRWSSTVADLNPADRLQFDGDTWSIHHVKPINRRDGLEITGSKVATPVGA
ncbi:MAG: phage head closure protein [Caulobacter sp.]|nr:phage head closure protein [Caulobacter sp.]